MIQILPGDCRTVLPTLPEESVQCVVTSPPYWGLRDYGTATWEGGEPACDHRRPGREQRYFNGQGAVYKRGAAPSARRSAEPYSGVCGKCGAYRIDQQLGLEPTPEEYVATMVGVFREVRRVLRDDGTCWVNMGDCYHASPAGNRTPSGVSQTRPRRIGVDLSTYNTQSKLFPGLKPKDLVGMPWRLAFALQADGWFLRSDIIWAKPNPMPESVTDRPTKAHEYVFLLTKAARYYYDADAVREPSTERDPGNRTVYATGRPDGLVLRANRGIPAIAGRNLRSVWTIPSEPTPDAHFATFPRKLVAPCILAGTSAKGCCGVCGAPWAREVDQDHPGDRSAIVQTYESHGVLNRRMHPGSHPTARRGTIGWQPTCAHDAPAVPCTVLDPFGGTGTVGRVAEDLGRDSILIELNAAYVRMAEQKTAQRGLFAS